MLSNGFLSYKEYDHNPIDEEHKRGVWEGGGLFAVNIHRRHGKC